MFKNTKPFSSYSIDDKEKALDFYKNTLGLSVEETPEGLNLSFSTGHSVFVYPKENHESATFTVLNFVVEDIDTAVSELIEKGVEMQRYAEMPGEQDEKGIMRGKAAGMGPDIAWFKDPAGNVLAVIED